MGNMIRRNITLFWLLPALVLCGAGREQQVFSQQIENTIDSLSHKIVWVNRRIAQETWKSLTTGQSDSLQFFVDFERYLVSDPQTASKLAQAGSQVTNEEMKRRLYILNSLIQTGRVDQSSAVTDLRDSIYNAYQAFAADFEGEVRSQQFLMNIVRTDPDQSRREMAYRAYTAVGSEVSDMCERLFRLRNQIAQKAGYNNYFSLAFAGRDPGLNDYVALIGKVDSLTAEPYNAILQRLRAQQPTGDVEIWDLYHAYAPALARLDQYIPVDSEMDYAKAGLRDIGIDLDNLPIYLYITEDNAAAPFAMSLIVDSPDDQRIIGNLNAGFQSTQMIMDAIGYAVSSAHTVETDPLFTMIQMQPFKSGIGHIFSDFVADTAWLRRYTATPQTVLNGVVDAERDRRIIELRLLLTDIMFEYESYQNPGRDLNQVYWDMVEKYAYLPRHDDIMPWAADLTFVTDPLSLNDDLIGRIIARQTMHYLYRTNGTVVGNRETRAFLVQNYFRFGSRYGWRELLNRGTTEGFDPAYLVK